MLLKSMFNYPYFSTVKTYLENSHGCQFATFKKKSKKKKENYGYNKLN